MPTSSVAPPEAVSARRWLPAVAMLLLSLLSYADRSILAVLSPTILRDLHLSAVQYSWAITAFSLSYMLANPLWGAWMDRLGLFRAALVAVALWSLASGAHALIAGFAGLCVARAVLGFGEGATFPAGLKTVADTLPPEQRATGMAVAYSGGSLGAAVTPLIVVPVAQRFGWRAAFGISLAAGFIWLVVWVALRRQLMGSVMRVEEPRTYSGARTGRFNRNLWAAAAIYGLGAAPLAFGLYAAPLYLARVLHVTQVQLGHLLWLPPLGWEAGYLVWGRVADRLKARGRFLPRAWFAGFAAAGALLPAIAWSTRLAHPVLWAMTGFVLTMFVAAGFVVFALAFGLETQPHNSAGFLAGFCISGWALATGAIMPLLGRLFDAGRYTESLWMMACVPVLGLGVWEWVRQRKTAAENR